MKTLYSTIFLIAIVAMTGMSFNSIEKDTRNLMVEDECRACHALVQEFDLLVPPVLNECMQEEAYKNINDAIKNYDPEDCYSLYSLFYNTLSFWAYQANCQGEQFCADVLCKAKCMAECLKADQVYSTTTNYIINYLEDACDCEGNECYQSCTQEDCSTCQEDCCGQPDLLMESIPGNPGCCRVKVSSPLNPCCNVDIIVVNVDESDPCITNLTAPGSYDVVVEVCCFEDLTFNPIIEIGAETLCNGFIALDYIYWDPREYEFCDEGLECCNPTITQTVLPSESGCCAILFEKNYNDSCDDELELTLSPALASSNPTVNDLGDRIFIQYCPGGFQVAGEVSATVQTKDPCSGQTVSSTWVAPCQ